MIDNLKGKLFVIIMCLCFNITQAQQIKNFLQVSERDSLIKFFLDEINPDSIRYYIQSLQDFKTRYGLAENKNEVVNWVAEKFRSFGYGIEIDSFQTTQSPWSSDSIISTQKNIIANLIGIENNKIIILGAHYDSINITGNPDDSKTTAPGADDNASGMAAILEIARVLKKNNFLPQITIRFVVFGAEEFGHPTGAKVFAEKAFANNVDIKLMINHDMIAYTKNLHIINCINIAYYPDFIRFRDYANLLTDLNTKIKGENGFLYEPGDSRSFWEFGYPAIAFNESDFNPHYHSTTDLIDHLNIDYCTEVVKASCATMLSFIKMPETEVNNFVVQDAGDGNSFVLSWSPNKDFNAAGYKIYLGKSSVNYDTSFITGDTTFIISNLFEDSLYYVGITTFDSGGYESFIEERAAVPRSIPLAPANLVDEPLMHRVKIRWSKNSEYDLAGYNVYRALTASSEEELKLNDAPVKDSLFIDDNTEDGRYYFYRVKAVDNDGNESSPSQTIRSCPLSLNRGILLVDETTDGNGSLMNPTDDQTDSFYETLLENFNNKNYDLIKEKNIKLADLGAYSTIFWQHNNAGNLSGASSILEDIKKYLEYGGKLLYAGYYPSKAFNGNLTYPKDFTAGDFVFDYLKIRRSDHSFGSRLRGAVSVSYNSIFTDTTKTQSLHAYHLSNIESISAAEEGREIYFYSTEYDTTTVQGSMQGMPVGVEYLGEDYKVIVLSFPLYYMHQEQAKELIENIMQNKFNEITGIEDENTNQQIPQEYRLYQNYPNPFNPRTNFEFRIAEFGLVTLKVYDILGREAAVIVNEEKAPGSYSEEWDASKFSSGVYLYKLSCNGKAFIKKMMLLK